MDDKQLRHLSRRDLLALLEELSRENDRLRDELNEANKKLEDRCVALSDCGSMAEAALVLGGVFEAADRATQIYKDSLAAQMSARPAPTVEEPSVEDRNPQTKVRPVTHDVHAQQRGQRGRQQGVTLRVPEISSAEGPAVRQVPRHARHMGRGQVNG